MGTCSSTQLSHSAGSGSGTGQKFKKLYFLQVSVFLYITRAKEHTKNMRQFVIEREITNSFHER